MINQLLKWTKERPERLVPPTAVGKRRAGASRGILETELELDLQLQLTWGEEVGDAKGDTGVLAFGQLDGR